MSIYQFCDNCEYKVAKYQGTKLIKYTCPAQFNPFEPMTEPDGTSRKDGKDGCPKNIRFMELEKSKRGKYA